MIYCSDRPICTEFEVDGLRADLIGNVCRTAVTLAAYEGRLEVTVDGIALPPSSLCHDVT